MKDEKKNQFLRKNPESIKKVVEEYLITPPEHHLFVGLFYKRMTVFFVCLTVFDSLDNKTSGTEPNCTLPDYVLLHYCTLHHITNYNKLHYTILLFCAIPVMYFLAFQACTAKNVSLSLLKLRTLFTGYTSQGSRTCSGQSAGFDFTGPADFLSAQSHTEL